MLTDLDLKQLEATKITPKEFDNQIESLSKGFQFLQIVKTAVVGDGIIRLDADEVDNLIDLYRTFEGSSLKFVPASGAATRMFKHLFEFRDDFPVKGMECFNDKTFNSIYYFFQQIKKFPFYDKLYNELWSIGYKMEELLENNDYLPIIDCLLNSDNGLDYAFLPKGLIYFHKYGDIARTALEEHIVEGAKYVRNIHGEVHLHLTVSPEHRNGFVELVERVKTFYENHYDVTLNITFSEQKPCTDTIAVDMDNNPFRNSDGTLLFRPGGHGALIENLNDLDSDIIFIKNIDNVAPDHLKPQTIRYKKALAGLLISYQNLIFDYLRRLTSSDDISDEFISDVMDFTRDELCITPSPNLHISNRDEAIRYLINVLNRPIRVCGMVKNQGEPGGGPFWAVNPNGTVSLQIVESSQIDLNNSTMKEIFSQSTHFNPVDLVCSTKDFNGQKFNLLEYRDPETGFISIKSKDGKQLKAMELPGLWNGAMSNWNTIFVEVPLATFSPVKTVNDLLRKEHQAIEC
ncbi:MAG: DUF4301 family protein [Bacteroidales bacterium]